MRFRFSIGQRTALGFALMVALVLVASSTGLFYTRSVEDTINATRDGADQLESVADLQISWLAVVATVDNMLLTRQTGLIEQRLTGELEAFNRQLDALQAGAPDEGGGLMAENRPLLADLQALGAELTGLVNELTTVSQEGRWARAQTLRHTDLASLQRRLNTLLDQLSTNIRAGVQDRVDESVRTQNANRTYWIVTAVLALVIGVVAGFLTTTSITRPIAKLVTTTQAIRGGDLSRRAEVTSQDEIGELAQSFNSMTDQLRESFELLEDRVNARTHDLQTAAEVSKQITTVLDIDELLRQVTTLTVNSYDLYASFVFLLRDSNVLERVAGANLSGTTGLLATLHDIPLDADPSIVALAARTRQPVVVNDVRQSTIHQWQEVLPNTRSELAVPMLLGERLIGVFSVQSTVENRFSDDDLRVLTTLAEQIAVAVRNAELFAEAENARLIAEQASQVKSQFLANMSHELRTPLNAIINFTGFVADGILGPVNDDQLDSLNKVINSSNHLLSLINDILDLTKIEVGMMDLFIQDVDLNESLTSLLSTAKGLVKDKPIEIVTDIEDNLPTISGDRRRIRQILLNMVSNAVKFTPEGRITIAAKHADDEVHLTVSDTGIGIPPDQQHLVFETFRQAKHELQETPGTGLGMPITKAFVEAHGGRIWFESEAGAGTTFYVVLPVKPVEADGEVEETAEVTA